MKTRWAPAFTIVELLMIIVVIAILATLLIISYNGTTKMALTAAAKSDLHNAATVMERELQNTNAYPATLPSDLKASNRVRLVLVRSGAFPYYNNLSPVQSGTLFATTCQALIDEGRGTGKDQGGTTRDYITGCGNWNHNSMQFTGWKSKVWNTPVAKQPLLDYANTFTVNGTWDKDQERVTKEFYTELIERYEQQGGKFPITSFWDYWATPSNGGVMQQPLDPNVPTRPFFCVEATVPEIPSILWHVSEMGTLKTGRC